MSLQLFFHNSFLWSSNISWWLLMTKASGFRNIGQSDTYSPFRAVSNWLSKVITWLRFLRLVIGLKDSRQFFNQWEAKPKPIAPCTRDISRASDELQVIAWNCDWFMELFVPVVIGRSNCFGFGFSTVIWKPLYCLIILAFPHFVFQN